MTLQPTISTAGAQRYKVSVQGSSRSRRFGKNSLGCFCLTARFHARNTAGDRRHELKYFYSILPCVRFARTQLTKDSKGLLLIYHALTVHLSLTCFSILQNGNIKVHALPTRTSGTTQPLNFAMFGSFKAYANE